MLKYTFSGLHSRCPESEPCVSMPGEPEETAHFLRKIGLKGNGKLSGRGVAEAALRAGPGQCVDGGR